MGTERLIARVVVVGFMTGAIAGCGHRAPPNDPSAVGVGHDGRRHAQIIQAMKTPERRALVARFRERNPTGAGPPWIVDDDALVQSMVVVEPFRGFLRRIRREPLPASLGAQPAPASPLSPDDAIGRARDFVRKNADLLGLPDVVVLGLATSTKEVDRRMTVRFEGHFPSKGYEAHDELENLADVSVTLDGASGEALAIANLSKVHPRLDLDLHPRLAEDDARVIAQLLGRRIFAVIGDGSDAGESGRALRPEELPRLPLGRVEADDILRITPMIHRAEGPRLAWVTYRLAYAVIVGKPFAEGLGLAPPVHFFRYVVDADTGDVLEDARAPLTMPAFGGEP